MGTISLCFRLCLRLRLCLLVATESEVGTNANHRGDAHSRKSSEAPPSAATLPLSFPRLRASSLFTRTTSRRRRRATSTTSTTAAAATTTTTSTSLATAPTPW